MRSRLLDISTSVAVIVTAAVVAYSALVRSKSSTSRETSAVGYYDDWETFLDYGIRVGNSSAPVKLIEFADYECSFCARYHLPVQRMLQEMGDTVEYVLVHSPLAQHRFAIPAARAAECALEQGRFAEMQDVLYAGQDSLGFYSWSTFALQAGITDTSTFMRCIRDARSRIRVDSGMALSERLRIPGTPTYVVNGHRVPGGGPDTLRSLISAVSRGKIRD